MGDPFLPYGRHHVTDDDIAAAVGALRSDWLTTGPAVERFERAFADRVGARFAVSFSSGTAALHGAATAAGIVPGDEAVTTPLTFCATANCVLYCGGTPVFADVCEDTLNINPAEVEKRITPNTRAIIAVDYAGHPADLDTLRAVADRHGLALIEDACHAPGAEYRGRTVGGISDLTVFSFHPVKHLTTGEGGMVTTDREDLARRLKRFRNHGIDTEARERLAAGSWAYDMVELGFNYRLSDIASALGLSQLARLGQNLRRRRQLVHRYREALAGLPWVRCPVERAGVRSAWHLFPVRIDEEAAGCCRDHVFRVLRAANIGVNVHYRPVHLHTYYRDRFGYCEGAFPVAEKAFSALLTLPLFPGMTDEDVDRVAARLAAAPREDSR